MLNIFILLEAPVSDWLKDVDNRVQYGMKFGKSRGFLKTGDTVIVVTGWQQGSGYTNTLRIVYVDEDLTFIHTPSPVVSDDDSYENLS